MSDLVSIFKALADETRLRLLGLLLDRELSVGEIVAAMDMGQPRISRHLKLLSDAGLLGSRRDGLWVFYSAAKSGPGREFIDALDATLRADPLLKPDAERFRDFLEKRRGETRRFFNDLAPRWPSLSRDILGGADLLGEIVRRLPACEIIADLGCGDGELLAALAAREKGADRFARPGQPAGQLGQPSQEGGVGETRRPGDRAGQGGGQTGQSDGQAVRSGNQAGDRPGQAALRRRLIGVDASPAMLEAARARLGDAASLRLGELEHLPLSDAEADCAVLSMTLHHLVEPEAALREARRALGPGGRLIVAELARHADESLRASLGDRWLGFDAEQLEGWLKRAGFAVVERARLPLKDGLAALLVTAIADL